MTTIITDPNKIRLYSLLVMRQRLKLEIKGMKFKGRSTNAIVKQRFGFKGNRESVLAQMIELYENEVSLMVASRASL